MEVLDVVKDKPIAIYLDYDGTLTPIVSKPVLAVLSDDQRHLLEELAKNYPVAIISGRDRKDVEQLVGLSDLYYAGSHGFDIAGPKGPIAEMGEEFLPTLDLAEKELHEALGKIEGLLVERKKYAIAIHFRLVDPKEVPHIENVVRAIQKKHNTLRMRAGKMIFELQPNIDWDKGKALLHLMELMHLDPKVIPIYIGDDVTDEDAFKVLVKKGVGIAVHDKPQKTYASFTLKNPEEVYQFFKGLLHGF